MAVPLVNLTHEGFGRVVITVGKLVVLDRALRDVHRFGYASLGKLKDDADKHLSVALELVGMYPEVAGKWQGCKRAEGRGPRKPPTFALGPRPLTEEQRNHDRRRHQVPRKGRQEGQAYRERARERAA